MLVTALPVAVAQYMYTRQRHFEVASKREMMDDSQAGPLKSCNYVTFWVMLNTAAKQSVGHFPVQYSLLGHISPGHFSPHLGHLPGR